MSKTKLPEIYFDRKGAYWLRLHEREFIELGENNINRRLQRSGVFIKKAVNEQGLTRGEEILMEAQDNLVAYAGPLAGHKCGILNRPDGSQILVTSEAKHVEPKKGRFDKWEKFLAELLPGDQGMFFLWWLKIALQTLRKGDFRPGQMIVLPGPSGCGKSFLQSLITVILGGRSAKPYRYMVGETTFNNDLLAAEHLVIEDENASASIQMRRKFGTSVKDFTVNVEMSLHEKGKTAVSVPTSRRLSLSVNNEAENLMILPIMDASISDKVMLFNCGRASLSDDRKKNWQEFTSEIPALAYELLQMSIPSKYRCSRFGVVAYHDKDVLEMLSDLSPETRLLNLIDEVIFKRAEGEDWVKYGERVKEPWQGSAEQLEQRLRASAFTFAVDKLLILSNSCGTYLGRLAGKFPDRISKTQSKGKAKWYIKKEAA